MATVGEPDKPSLLPGSLVQQHVASCQITAKSCGLCFWGRHKEYWRSNLASNWPQVTLKGQSAKVGCAPCALAKAGGPWALFQQNPLGLRLHHFKRHEASKGHQAAVSMAGNAEATALAPEMNVFEEAFKRMKSGGSARDSGSNSDKKRQVRWCLSEACLELSRQTLREAVSIAITRDERKGRLLLRWRAARPDLSSASGVLGLLPAEGFADSLADESKAAIRDFCKPCLDLPRGFVSQNPLPTDPQVEANIIKNTQILVTDAASSASGLLAGRRPYAQTGACETYFSDLKVIGRDAAHASVPVMPARS